VLCLLRRLGCHNDRINAPIAGFISAFSLAIEGKARKQLFLILMLARGVDSSINLLEDSGIIPRFSQKYLVIWFVANCLLQSLMGMKQDLLNRGL
jgi:hypothetical protein